MGAIGGPLREALSALALAGCAALWIRASRSLRSGPWPFRLADGFLLLCWVGIVSFYLLAGLGAYRLLPAIGLTGLGGVVALMASRTRERRGPAVSEYSEQAVRAEEAEGTENAWTPYGLPALVLVFATPTALLASLRLLKSLVAPTVAWDAITYHLPKAAMWVQSGSLTLPEFPDAWSYYAWFPGGSEILWSWLMLASRDDNFVGPLGFLIWILIALSAARLARDLGASEPIAAMTAVSVASLPAILSFMTAAHADNPATLFQLLAVTHALRYLRVGKTASALHAAAATGLGAAVKITGLVLAVPTALVLLIGLARFSTRKRFLAPLLAFLMVLPAVGYLRTWSLMGSPVYPSKTPILEELPYHQGLERITSGRAFPQNMVRLRSRGGLERLFWEGGTGRGHANFGLGGLVLALLAAAALVKGLTVRRLRGALLFLWSGVVLVTPLFLSPSVLALRTIWIGILGRHLVSACAAAFVCASLLPRRIVVYGLGLSIAGSLVHAFPLGWSQVMVGPALGVALVAAGLAVVWLRGRQKLFRSGPLSARAAAWAAAFVVVYVGWDALRHHVRYPIYAEAGDSVHAFDIRGRHPRIPSQVPLWAYLDTPESKRIAVTAGWEGAGPNQFFLPLLGSRLQNRLTYIPTTSDGRDSQLWHTDRWSRADARAWLERVDALAPDYLVGLAPDTPEREWVERRNDRFELLPLDGIDENWLARLK